MKRLVLWDVDHTLIENAGVSKEAYAEAFAFITGRPATAAAVVTDGGTDPIIMANLFAAHGLAARWDQEVTDALATALASRADRLANLGHALPGAAAILSRLHADPQIVQSVLTGNIQPNAVVKLAAFNLDSYIDFEVGGFGSDRSVRADLVAVAQQRASAKYGTDFGPTNTVVLGDTLRDVEAGRTGGSRVIAVATGVTSVRELSQAGADRVLDDLTDTVEVHRAIVDQEVDLPPEEPAATQVEATLDQEDDSYTLDEMAEDVRPDAGLDVSL